MLPDLRLPPPTRTQQLKYSPHTTVTATAPTPPRPPPDALPGTPPSSATLPAPLPESPPRPSRRLQGLWTAGCFNSDILAAIDDAVSDGANVISLSLGSGPVPTTSTHRDRRLRRHREGGPRLRSAGNDGPGEMTATNVAPWIATVGAGSIDRSFPPTSSSATELSSRGLHPHRLRVGRLLPARVRGERVHLPCRLPSSAPFCMPGSLDRTWRAGRWCCASGAPCRAPRRDGRQGSRRGRDDRGQPNDRRTRAGPRRHLLPAVAVGARRAS
ncbi:uncharacterized protein M6B38_198310 [Iris pallida]|uniref:Peptidase S8/S53 domain-containing protein n=1 Tax=Iris pallida TaxID=29817 RepID=A0AAX6EBW3_IRIPA|nr:uncharacterized protein M6B38_198310 [Iris pallida]